MREENGKEVRKATVALDYEQGHREVMRQTRSETDNVSELTIDDVWTDAKDDVLFEDLVSAARLHILRCGPSKGCRWA